jgi:hypothetical protein
VVSLRFDFKTAWFLMHARDLAELAALVAIHSPLIVQGQGRVPPGANEEYWAASKCRLDRWTRLLRQLTAAVNEPRLPATLAWARVRPVLEEIITSELLTRLWAATAAAHDAERGDDELGPAARNIFAGHLDVRRRLLALLADGRTIELPQAVRLNHLRRRVERWTDMLLAHVGTPALRDEFACEPERARDFASDLDRDSAWSQRRLTTKLALASLRASFAEGLDDRSPSSDLNRRIGSAILAAFREEITDSMGLVKSLWLERISQTASDTEGMIEELLDLDREQPLFPVRWGR